MTSMRKKQQDNWGEGSPPGHHHRGHQGPHSIEMPAFSYSPRIKHSPLCVQLIKTHSFRVKRIPCSS